MVRETLRILGKLAVATSLVVLKASPPIGSIKYRKGDARPWIKTGTYSYALLNSAEGKKVATATGQTAPIDGNPPEAQSGTKPKPPAGFDVDAKPGGVQRAGVLLIDRKTGKLVLGEAQGEGGRLDTFKGKIEEGEDPKTAALRELQEEAGLDFSPEDLALVTTIDMYGQKVALYGVVADVDVSKLHCSSLIEGATGAKADRNGKPEMSGYKMVDPKNMGSDRMFNALWKGLKDDADFDRLLSSDRSGKEEKPVSLEGKTVHPIGYRGKIAVGECKTKDDGSIWEKITPFNYRKISDGGGSKEQGADAGEDPVEASAMDKLQRGEGKTLGGFYSLTKAELERLVKKYGGDPKASFADKKKFFVDTVLKKWKDSPETPVNTEAPKEPEKPLPPEMQTTKSGFKPFRDNKKIRLDPPKVGSIQEKHSMDDYLAGAVPGTEKIVEAYKALLDPPADIRKKWEAYVKRQKKSDPGGKTALFNIYEWMRWSDAGKKNSEELKDRLKDAIAEHLPSEEDWEGSPMQRYAEIWRKTNPKSWNSLVLDPNPQKSITRSGAVDVYMHLSTLNDYGNQSGQSVFGALDPDTKIEEKEGLVKLVWDDRRTWQEYLDDIRNDKDDDDAREKHAIDIPPYTRMFWRRKDKYDRKTVEEYIERMADTRSSNTDEEMKKLVEYTGKTYSDFDTTTEMADFLKNFYGNMADKPDARGSIFSALDPANKSRSETVPFSLEELVEEAVPVYGGHWGSAETTNRIAAGVAWASGSSWRPIDKMEQGRLKDFEQTISYEKAREGIALRKMAQKRLKSPEMSREKVPTFFRGQTVDPDSWHKILSGDIDQIDLTGCTAITCFEDVAHKYATSTWTNSFGKDRLPIEMTIERDDSIDDSIGMFHQTLSEQDGLTGAEIVGDVSKLSATEKMLLEYIGIQGLQGGDLQSKLLKAARENGLASPGQIDYNGSIKLAEKIRELGIRLEPKKDPFFEALSGAESFQILSVENAGKTPPTLAEYRDKALKSVEIRFQNVEKKYPEAASLRGAANIAAESRETLMKDRADYSDQIKKVNRAFMREWEKAGLYETNSAGFGILFQGDTLRVDRSNALQIADEHLEKARKMFEEQEKVYGEPVVQMREKAEKRFSVYRGEIEKMLDFAKFCENPDRAFSLMAGLEFADSFDFLKSLSIDRNALERSKKEGVQAFTESLKDDFHKASAGSLLKLRVKVGKGKKGTVVEGGEDFTKQEAE